MLNSQKAVQTIIFSLKIWIYFFICLIFVANSEQPAAGGRRVPLCEEPRDTESDDEEIKEDRE